MQTAELLGRVRPGARRPVQLHDQVGHERAARQRLRLHHQRGAGCPSAVHRRAPAQPQAQFRLQRRRARSPCRGVYAGRNRTFFFANLEVFRNRTNSPGARATVPTQAYRNGDFSAALTGRVLGTDPLGRPIMENAIYDPRTTRIVNGQVVRDPFPNNVIPSELFDPVALQIQSLIPAPDNGELLNNYAPGHPEPPISDDPDGQDRPQPREPARSSRGTGRRSSPIRSRRRTGCPSPSRRGAIRKSTVTRIRRQRRQDPEADAPAARRRGLLCASTTRTARPDDVLNYDAAGELGFVGSATDPSGFPVITGLGSNAPAASTTSRWGPATRTSTTTTS